MSAGLSVRDTLAAHLAVYADAAQAAVPVTPRDISLCPACQADACFTCWEGTCKCPCQDDRPVRAVRAAPRRCGSCGYLETAVGHRIACGSKP